MSSTAMYMQLVEFIQQTTKMLDELDFTTKSKTIIRDRLLGLKGLSRDISKWLAVVDVFKSDPFPEKNLISVIESCENILVVLQNTVDSEIIPKLSRQL